MMSVYFLAICSSVSPNLRIDFIASARSATTADGLGPRFRYSHPYRLTHVEIVDREICSRAAISIIISPDALAERHRA